MKSSAKETTAEWIGEQLKAIIGSYPKKDIDATMPVILMYMTREFGFDALEPKMRAGVLRIFEAAGVDDRMSPNEVTARLDRYVEGLNANGPMLLRVQAVFHTHYAALRESALQDFRKLGGDRKKRTLPPKLGAARPEGTVKVPPRILQKV